MHGTYLRESGEGERRRSIRARSRLLALLEERFRRAVEARRAEADGLEEAVRAVVERREDPYSAASRLFERFVRDPGEPRDPRRTLAGSRT